MYIGDWAEDIQLKMRHNWSGKRRDLATAEEFSLAASNKVCLNFTELIY